MMMKASFQNSSDDVDGDDDDVPNSHMQVTTTIILNIFSNVISVQGMSDTVWKVGCYRINPSTPSGQKFFILHMLVLPLIP